ncbi:uncharacterized protein [Desmodus rotundus]|uniref:uncharacterized protein n=1 Tax=Desmodus rotundus TaxID=9430 RepID=UPI0039E24228
MFAPQAKAGQVDKENSTQSTEEQQLDDGDPCSSSVREGQGSHTTEDQSRPKVNVATWGTEKQGPRNGRRKTPDLKLSRLPSHLSVLDPSLEHGVPTESTRPEDLEPEEAEPEAPAQEAELAPSLPSVIWPKEPTAGADLQTAPYSEGRPTSSVLPPPSPAPAEVLEPGPAYAAAPDLTEALRPWPKEPSLEPAPGPAREEENAPAPVLEPLVAAATSREVVCLSMMAAAIWGLTQHQDLSVYSLSSLSKASNLSVEDSEGWLHTTGTLRVEKGDS